MPDAHRMRVALAILAQNLRGNGFDALKPVSASLASDMADLAIAALCDDPHDFLDKVIDTPAETANE